MNEIKFPFLWRIQKTISDNNMVSNAEEQITHSVNEEVNSTVIEITYKKIYSGL